MSRLEPYLAARQSLRTAPPVSGWSLGRLVSRELVEQLDRCLIDLFESAAEGVADVALVALGGFGRRDLCLESDVDLLLLYRGELPTGLAQEVLYPLWDAKLTVGHAVRNQRDVVRAGRESVESLTSMLTGRFLAGDRQLWSDAQDGLEQIRRKDRARLVSHILDEERSVRESLPYHVMDPDLKAGRGALRTVHRLAWLQLITGNGEIASKAEAAETVLLTARNGVHAWAGRPAERLHADALAGASRWSGIAPGVLATEVLRAVRTVELEFDREHAARTARPKFRVRRAKAKPMSEGGVLGPIQTAIENGSRLRPEALAEMGSTVGQWSPVDRSALVAWASSGAIGRSITEQLWDSGWLASNIPELNHTVGLSELAPFHSHPVDVHLWRTVDELLILVGEDSPEPWFRELAESVGSLDDLIVACLFHDVGKGTGQDHSEAGAALARRFLDRSGWPGAAASLIERAIELHLLLPRIATRSDLRDPGVIEDVSSQVGDPQLVRALALLTAADSRATGPSTWTAWKSTLVRSLTTQLLSSMGDRSPTPIGSGDAGAQTKEFSHEALEDHIASMGEGYVDRFDQLEIALHFELVKHPLDEGEVRLNVHDEGDVTRCVVAARDRPGFLVAVSGALALHGIDVLDARLATSTDGIAIDTFHVEDAQQGGVVPGDRWVRVERTLGEVLSGSLDLEAALTARRHAYRHRYPRATAPAVRVAFDGGAPTLEVVADDRIGLLHDIAKVILDHGHSVDLAKIDTRGGIVTDVFHFDAPAAATEVEATAAALRDLLSHAESL